MNRPQISELQIQQVVANFEMALRERLQQKGHGAFVSTHEIVGVVAEEYDEMMDALRQNNRPNFRSELLDVAVGCVFGVACVDAGTLDW